MADDRDLITAYLDGVTELAPDERRRVEALLAADPDAAAEATATRAMLDQLRALPRPATSAEPDLRALGDAIARALPVARPRSRVPIYVGAVALVALVAVVALVALVVASTRPTPTPPSAAMIAPPAPIEPARRHAASHVWLGDDGDALELDLDAEQTAAAIDELTADYDLEVGTADPFGDQFGARIDTVDDAAMERIEHWLAEKG